MVLNRKTIKKLQKSRVRNKRRAQKNHNRKLQIKREEKNLIKRNYRNLNSITLQNNQSLKHNYSKFIIGIYLKEKGIDFLTEFKFSNGIADIYSPSEALFFEIEANGHREKKVANKLEKYESALNSGLINDVHIIPLEKFTFNVKKDLKMIGEYI